MFAKFATIVVASTLFLAAAAAPTDGGEVNQCNGAAPQCCNSTQNAKALGGPLTALLGLLGVDVKNIQGLVGVTCSPITVIGASGSSCTSQPVCCTNNQFNGIVAIGCTPINVSL